MPQRFYSHRNGDGRNAGAAPFSARCRRWLRAGRTTVRAGLRFSCSAATIRTTSSSRWTTRATARINRSVKPCSSPAAKLHRSPAFPARLTASIPNSPKSPAWSFRVRSSAVILANTGSLVQPLTRSQYQNQQAADSAAPVLAFRSATRLWQTSIAQGHSATGWAGRAADYVASQNMNSSGFPGILPRSRVTPLRGGRSNPAGSAGPGAGRCSCQDSTAPRLRRRGSALSIVC